MSDSPAGGAWLAGYLKRAETDNPEGTLIRRYPHRDGAITFGEVVEAFPFQNVLATTTLTGAQADQVLEQGTNPVIYSGQLLYDVVAGSVGRFSPINQQIEGTHHHAVNHTTCLSGVWCARSLIGRLEEGAPQAKP